jgi:PTS system nitrogen regulatory IIA component
MTLAARLRPSLIFLGLEAKGRDELLRALSERIFAAGAVADAEELYAELRRREELGSTGIGGGVAIPHCKLKGLDQVVLALATAGRAIDYDSADGQPTRVFFVVVSPDGSATEHLRTLADISRWIKDSNQVRRLLDAREPEAVLALFERRDTP